MIRFHCLLHCRSCVNVGSCRTLLLYNIPPTTQVVASHSCGAGAAATAVQRLVSQKHFHFFNYLTEPEWAVLTSDAPLARKLDATIDRMLRIGLTHPSEPTIVAILSIVEVAAGDEWAPKVSIDNLSVFKQRLKVARSSGRCAVGMGRRLMEYPEKVDDYMRDHKDVYEAAAPPSTTKVEPNIVDLARLTKPCRRSHKTVALSTIAQSSIARPDDFLHQMAFAAWQTMQAGRKPKRMLSIEAPAIEAAAIEASAGPSPSTPETSTVRSILDKTKPLPISSADAPRIPETMPSAVGETTPTSPVDETNKPLTIKQTPPLTIKQTASKPEGGDGLDVMMANIQEAIRAKKAAGKMGKGKGKMAKGKEEKNPIVEPAIVVKKRPASKMEGHT